MGCRQRLLNSHSEPVAGLASLLHYSTESLIHPSAATVASSNKFAFTLLSQYMMTEPYLLIQGTRVPQFLYGTAWKEDRTADLTEISIKKGFRGIDTANQRKHYYEAAVGEGIVAAINAGIVQREDLFLQTKFTFKNGQDHRLPYDPAAPIAQQVEQSFTSSLSHLNSTYLDSYVLHGPSVRTGLAEADMQAWLAMESLHSRGLVRLLGVSNVSLAQLELLCSRANVPPRFVQNRCYVSTGWDRDVRQFCTEHGITYQGFSLLTANRSVVTSPVIAAIARRYDRTPAQIIFRFAIDVGMLPLTGTTNASHMQADIAVQDFALTPQELKTIELMAM